MMRKVAMAYCWLHMHNHNIWLPAGVREKFDHFRQRQAIRYAVTWGLAYRAGRARRLWLIVHDVLGEAALVVRFLFVKFPAFGHEIRAESGEGFGQTCQLAFGERPQHEGAADLLDFDFLARLDDGEPFGDVDGQRVAAFENAREHGCLLLCGQAIDPPGGYRT